MCEIEFLNIEKNNEYEAIIKNVLKECFLEEKLDKTNLYIEVTLTTPEDIKKINKEFRNINKETDVLSFPMFEKEELSKAVKSKNKDALGSIVISIKRVYEQAEEYGHSFERELSYMVVHGFYHLMGYDHIDEAEKKQMRKKEEVILNNLNIVRN